MKATIKDIALKAGVSVSSVSLVLNNKTCRISEETKFRIRSIAKELDYTANQSARSLVTKQSKVLGLIIPDIENIFFASLCKHIEEYCREQGYALMIMYTNDRLEDDLRVIDLLASRGVDGLFITVSNESFQDKEKVQSKLQYLKLPFVMVDRYYDGFMYNTVFFDNRYAAYEAVQHLIEAGHKQIACISGPCMSINGNMRLKGYKEAMKVANYEIKASFIYTGDFRIQSGYEAAKQIIESKATAVFICNDMMSLGFLKYIDEIKKEIPKDISLISYDNTLNVFYQGMTITVIEQNVSQLAIAACDLLFETMYHKDDCKQICLRPKLILKDSVKEI